MIKPKKAVLTTLTISFATLSIASTPSTSVAQSQFPYRCEASIASFPPIKERSTKFAKNLPHLQYYLKLIEIWDAGYVREGCEAFLRGENYDDSCLNGRRPLDEIEEKIPKGFYALGPADSAKAYNEIRNDRSLKEAFAFCRANGFYTSFKYKWSQ